MRYIIFLSPSAYYAAPWIEKIKDIFIDLSFYYI